MMVLLSIYSLEKYIRRRKCRRIMPGITQKIINILSESNLIKITISGPPKFSEV